MTESLKPIRPFSVARAHRLIDSKYPTVDIFDDIADPEDFDAIFAVQALTNPRLTESLGDIKLVKDEDRPLGIQGFNYALGPFVHVNQLGGRFSKGGTGAYYCADTRETAIAETLYHQEKYFRNVEGLHYDRITMRVLVTKFSADLLDVSESSDEEIYHDEDYSKSQALSEQARKQQIDGIAYHSVRDNSKDNMCYALLTPKVIKDVVQASLVDYVWNGKSLNVIGRIEQVKL